MLSQDDRLTFSLKIVTTDAEVKGVDKNKLLFQSKLSEIQKVDTANKNLFDPLNSLVSSYQVEWGYIDGKNRTIITEQDIQDSAAQKIQNHFFPNDETVSVPSLSSEHNIWTKPQPFALTYCIGKNYSEAYPPQTPYEQNLISTIQGYITQAGSYTDYANTTGIDPINGVCSNPMYSDQTTCEGGGGTWTSGPHQVINGMVPAVNSLRSLLISMVASIVTSDSDVTRQSQNNVAINNINNIIIPAIDTWLSYPDFNLSNIPPTKLHSTQLSAFSSAISARLSFITGTRIPQLTNNLGNISQNISTGDVSGSGMYLLRYKYLSLRLDSFNGSLTQVVGLQTSISAQDSIKNSLLETKSTYFGIVPTSSFKAPANGTEKINLNDVSFLSVGDTVYIAADSQQELKRAIRSINGTLIALNDVIPAKYRPQDNARLYKDIS